MHKITKTTSRSALNLPPPSSSTRRSLKKGLSLTINQSNATPAPSIRILQDPKHISKPVSLLKDIFSKIGTQQQPASTSLLGDSSSLQPQEILNTNRPTTQPEAPELLNAYEEPSTNIPFISNRPDETALASELELTFPLPLSDQPTNQENFRAGPFQEAIKEKATTEAEAADDKDPQHRLDGALPKVTRADDTSAEDIKDEDFQEPQDAAKERELLPPLQTPTQTLTAGLAGVFHYAAGDADFIPDHG